VTVDQLRQVIRDLPPLPDTAPEFTWLGRRIALRDHILKEDPQKFLEWSTIVATMDIKPESQNYHLDLWEQQTGRKIADLNSIVEFGGGYGAMIKMVHERGFSGRYYSYDFPELIALQRFYLPEIDILTDIPKECDLFIAICSISEACSDEQQDFMSKLSFEHCLICYQGQWGGVDNHKSFGHLGKRHQDINGNHWYMIR